MQGMLTGLLGNLSLLSYFAKKKEKEAAVIQTLGVISIHVVLTQLAMAGAMPLPSYVATSVVVGAGLILNFLNYVGMLNATIWQFWEDFITVGGLSVLPQVSSKSPVFCTHRLKQDMFTDQFYIFCNLAMVYLFKSLFLSLTNLSTDNVVHICPIHTE